MGKNFKILIGILTIILIALGLYFLWKNQKKVESEQTVENIQSEDIKSVLPRDAIPAILEPKFETIAETKVKDNDLVISVENKGEAKAYPLNILNWHEVVDDEIEGLKIAVTFCPLCYSGVAFERTLEGQVYTFGVSGKLFQDNLVMYDKQTETLWQQLTGQAIQGPLSGKKLTPFPSQIIEFGEFKQKYPQGEVLSRDTGAFRNYDVNPYEGYETSSDLGISGFAKPDTRLPAKELIFGIVSDGQAKAYPLSKLPEKLSDQIGDQKVEITYSKETKELNSTLPGFYSFWFSWARFYPDTEVYQ